SRTMRRVWAGRKIVFALLSPRVAGSARIFYSRCLAIDGIAVTAGYRFSLFNVILRNWSVRGFYADETKRTRVLFGGDTMPALSHFV
ncbi:hypothetical protein ABTA44_20065, partial [Acinetobacter baumannii]